MKKNNTPWLFVATVAIFWAALMMGAALSSERRKFDETTTLSYTIPANVTKLHIDDVDYLSTYSGANIEFTQDAHITLEIDNSSLEQLPQDASIFFEQQGDQLVLRPLPTDSNTPDDDQRPSWKVANILLPTAINELSSTSEDIRISDGIQIPKLTIRSHNRVVIKEADIDQLSIYSVSNHPEHCSDSDAIDISSAAINQLYIESYNGYIEILGADTIAAMELHTSPKSRFHLNPISAMKRIQWQALDEAKKPSPCQSTSAPNHTIKQDK